MMGVMPKIRGIRPMVAGFVLSFFLAACASDAEVENMVQKVDPQAGPPRSFALKHAVGVAVVDGGRPTLPLFTPEISNEAFAAAIKEAKEAGGDPANLIGQFGVGFYSAFMAASEVRVYTRSFKAEGEDLVWISDGQGEYRIERTEDTQRRGAKIVVKLQEEAKEFSQKSRVEEVLKRYSSFVQFPINLNGERVNTIDALWLRNKSEIKEDERFFPIIIVDWEITDTMRVSSRAPAAEGRTGVELVFEGEREVLLKRRSHWSQR